MQKLRVAVVTRYPYAEADAFSGLVQVSLRLCDALARREDVELTVISRAYQPRQIERRQVRGYEVIYVPYSASPLRNPTFYFGAAERIRQELLRLRPGIVHCQATPETAIGSLRSGLPVVATIHGIYAAEAASARSLRARLAFPLIGAIERWYVRRMPVVMSGTPYVFRYVRRYNPAARLYPVSNPIDPAFFAGGLEQMCPEPHSIILVGTIYPRKGHDLMIEALRLLAQELPDVRLTIAGNEVDPTFSALVRARMETYGLQDRVRWLGPVPQERLIAEMRRHRVLCLPSREDTLPMVLSQAMAVGNIPVASDAGGIPDMLKNGERGFLFPRENPPALARTLADVLRMSEERLGMLQRANRAYAEHTYHDDGVAAQTVAVYREQLAVAAPRLTQA